LGMTAAQKGRFVTGRFFLYVALSVVALSMLLPFIWMLVTCVKEQGEVFTIPPRFIPGGTWHWENFGKVLSLQNFALFFLNSCIVSVSVVVGSLFVNSLSAYSFARLRFPGRNAIFML